VSVHRANEHISFIILAKAGQKIRHAARGRFLHTVTIIRCADYISGAKRPWKSASEREWLPMKPGSLSSFDQGFSYALSPPMEHAVHATDHSSPS